MWGSPFPQRGPHFYCENGDPGTGIPIIMRSPTFYDTGSPIYREIGDPGSLIYQLIGDPLVN